MAILKAFKGLCPKKEFVDKVVSLPYYALNRVEAKDITKNNSKSLLHVTKSEIDFDNCSEALSENIFAKAKENFDTILNDKIFVKEEDEHLYVYAITIKGITQHGLMGCSYVNDFYNNIIRKHEVIKFEEVENRKRLLTAINTNVDPAVLAYKDNAKINSIIALIIKSKPKYDFSTADGAIHRLWVMKDFTIIKRIEKIFEKEVHATYITEGHYIVSAASLYAKEQSINRRYNNDRDSYNFFLSIYVPANQLKIIEFNRAVKDLNNLTPAEFINKLKLSFDIEELQAIDKRPAIAQQISMYLGDKWYILKMKTSTKKSQSYVDKLDISVFNNLILREILNIDETHNTERIEYIGGINGINTLENFVNSNQMKAAFALYPVTMDELIDVVDSGDLMPLKTTWFEPKFLSGLVLRVKNED